MEAFGHFLAKLLSRPRQAWAGLAISAAVLLTLQHFALGPANAGSLGQSANLAAWVALSVGCTFFALNIVIDTWNFASAKIRERSALKAARQKFTTSSSQTRALLTYMVLNNESVVWVMNDYEGLTEFITKGFGYTSGKIGAAVELECRSTAFDWVSSNLASLSNEEAGASARARLLASLERAAREAGSMRA